MFQTNFLIKMKKKPYISKNRNNRRNIKKMNFDIVDFFLLKSSSTFIRHYNVYNQDFSKR